ncbi:NAD(P)/FAD-dependent oxidoreductase [Microbacterium sp. STN6]|uniref:NAD(P)/FAD-dependent oxidoreductase n=1 Tax=Microbacterium sp. STN6 TaxID=2995588 RepID=UPI002260859B|nr:NAD(P)/FAD-dependent oxidoreductase [Microbacterium sp. STN6]MCX7522587.1 NAD(P)/FAD-dependent oxidoreductase [Microbacterium sp. STN6]
MSEEEWDVIVVGGSAAGLSAALMLGRARRRVLVLDAGQPRNRFAAHMHGVLGNEGADPAEFLQRARAEVAGYGVQVRRAEAASVRNEGSGLSVTTDDGRTLRCRRLVAASGLRDELPQIAGLAERWGIDVLHCPYCHGWEVRGQRFGVIANNAMAAHQAQLVRQWSDDVVFFAAGAGDGAGVEVDEPLRDRLASRGVRVDDRAVREVVVAGGRLTGVRVDGGGVVALDAIFTAGTMRPNDEYLAGLELKRDETPVGSFLSVDGTGRTSNARVWAVGNLSVAGATVPLAIAAGAMAGGMVNMDLIEEEFDEAVAGR